MKKIILSILAIIISVLQLYSQSDFSQKVLLEDLNQFFDIVENSHPDPYSGFGGKMQFNRQVQQVRNAIPENGLSKADFQHILSAFVAKIHDGHTYINEETSNTNNEKALLLNIRFKILTDG